MIVVDASALVAIGDREDDGDLYLRALNRSGPAVISAINMVEVGLVLIGRQRLYDIDKLNAWLSDLKVKTDETHVSGANALAAYLRFGRGYHRAGLNLADCFAYALAKSLDAPLLYKGNNFALTDIRSALQPT